MGVTSDFVKLRSSKAPKAGEWNKDYKTALSKAKKEGKFIVTCWSNGDACGYCVTAEKCMMQASFKDWMAKQDAYFVFQYSGDRDKGQAVWDWIFKDGGVKQYPGFRATLYDASGNVVVDKATTGNDLRSKKTGAAGAKAMAAALEAVFASKPAGPEPVPEGEGDAGGDYKVRLNESLTTKQVNKILDAIDKNDGYCPCQPKGEGTKCHCDDFVKKKKVGEPCICKIYVKQKK
jgi:hypothetical protein